MIIIKNGLVHDGLGNVGQLDVAIKNHVIVDLGEHLENPNATYIDASNSHVFPGFIDSLNVWGTVGPGWLENDHHEASSPLNPSLDIIYGFDHDGMNFQRAYQYGVTSAGIAPAPKNILSGHAAVFKTYGRSAYDMLVKQKVALTGSVTKAVKKTYIDRKQAPMTRMGIFSMLHNSLKTAVHYKQSDNYDEDKLVLQAVIAGKLPLILNCSGQSQIEACLKLKESYPDLKLILSGAYGYNLEISKSNLGFCPLIIGDHTETYLPDNLATNHQEIIELLEHGSYSHLIAIGCCGDSTCSGKESLLWNAIHWRRHGLSSETCLKAITSNPARILGVDDRIGSIEIGKDADLSVWNGNPFDSYLATVKHVFINGNNVLDMEVSKSCW